MLASFVVAFAAAVVASLLFPGRRGTGATA
jgi:hypothetical protein